jgi:arylsulfatase A
VGDYKLHVMTQDGYLEPRPTRHDPPLLFNLGRDPGESHNVAAEHPEIVKAILEAMETHRQSVVPGNPQF